MRALLGVITFFWILSCSAWAMVVDDERLLYALACDMDISNQAALIDASELLITLQPSRFEWNRISAAEKKQWMNHRASIKNCLMAQLGKQIADYQASEAQALEIDAHRRFHTIQWMAANVMNGFDTMIRDLPPSDLFSPTLTPIYKAMQQPLPLSLFLAPLGGADQVDTLASMAQFVHEEWSPVTFEDKLMEHAGQIAALPHGVKQDWATAQLLRIFARNLFHLTDRGRAAYAKTFNVKDMPDKPDINSLLSRVQETIGIEKARFDAMANTIRQEPYRLFGIELREADILMDSRSGGFGQFFQFVIHTPAMYGHQAVVVTETLDDWTATYRAEIQNGLNFGSIAGYLGNTLVLRPVMAGQTSVNQVLQDMEGQALRFDAAFSYENEALYCSEFIDVAIRGTGRPSPFPDGAEQLDEAPIHFMRNMAHIGVDATGVFALSDRMLQNPAMRVITVLAQNNVAQHPSRTKLVMDLTLDMHERLMLGSLLTPFRPLSLWERIAFTAIRQWAEWSGRTELSGVAFSSFYQSLFFLKTLMLFDELDQITHIPADASAAMPLSNEDITKKKERYQSTLLPKIQRLFRTPYQGMEMEYGLHGLTAPSPPGPVPR